MSRIRFRRILRFGLASLLLAGCGDDEPDAYGSFEATEVVVSAETPGRLLRFDVREGDRLVRGALVAQVDTVPLGLQRRELTMQRRAAGTRTAAAEAEVGVLRAQLQTARTELARTRRLHAAEAATARELDRAEGEVRVLEARIAAATEQTSAAREETAGIDARVEQVAETLRRGSVTNPIGGVVLATFAEAGEFVQPGQPLYEIAELDPLELRAYVTGSQLGAVRIGAEVEVRVDAPDGGLARLPGRVVWLSPRAEFTPTPVQTRDERADHVYALRIRVPNPDGMLKIGMPGEVVLATADPAEARR